ncbi:MAG: PEP-CTERM sorting domain-containing protein, partial [Cyanobacteria bacterium J06623_7]
ELTFANTLILGTLLVCIVAFAIEVLQGYRGNQKVFSRVQAIAHTLMLFTGVYLGAILLIYAIPVAAYVAAGAYHLTLGFFSFDWVEGFFSMLFMGHVLFLLLTVLMIILFGFSISLFVAMPLAITHLYINSGKKIIQAFAQQYGNKRALQIGVTVVASWLIVFNIFNQQ